MLGVVVAVIALGGVAVATEVGTDSLWLSVPLGVAAPIVADQLRRRVLSTLDSILNAMAGIKVVPNYWSV